MLNLWLKNIEILKKYSDELIEDCFFSVRVKFIIKLLNQINKISYDERIFEYFQNLTQDYRQTVELYELNKEFIQNPKVKDILSGLNEVLSVQLKEFEENENYSYLYCGKNAKDKAMGEAKQEALDRISQLYSNYINNQGIICSEFVIQENIKSQNLHDTYIQVLIDIYESIINNNFEEIYKLYLDIVKKSIDKNFEYRRNINDCYEFIKNERINLENIIKIQVNVLEDTLKVEQLSETEREKVHQILDKLIEAYQYLGKEIEGPDIYFKSADNRDFVFSAKSEIADYLLKEGRDKYIQDHKFKDFPSNINKIVVQYEENNKNFNEQFKNYVENLIEKQKEIAVKDSENEEFLSKYKEDKLNFTKQFIQCFKDLKSFYESLQEEFKTTEYIEILNGIYETIAIKIESLEESMESFKQGINSYKPYGVKEYNIDTSKILQNALDSWYSYVISSDEKVFEENLKSLEQNIAENEEFTLYAENVNKQQQKQNEDLEKMYVKFLKESLLFELSTYEEILNYSVSRLREEQKLDCIKAFVEQIDAVNHTIDTLLEENDIQVLRPLVHEKFDAKQHEILMAEKQEGFEKGEVVKTLNSGYKYKDNVIVRANIIASR